MGGVQRMDIAILTSPLPRDDITLIYISIIQVKSGVRG
jgi:hypothetical protein